MRTLRRLAALAAATLACSAMAQGDPAATALLRKYAGSDDNEGLLREPAVRAELPKLLGAQMRQFMQNLEVRGSVDVVGGMLTMSGNAPHRGTEEEAIVCVAPNGKPVQAAIFSRGAVTVFAREANYEYLTLCIKDWITLVNSRHADRVKQPGNVRVVVPR